MNQKGSVPIHERFHAFQGEGAHMGKSAFFIRTYGCPVRCPWCDSAGTWHPNWTPPEGVERMFPEQLLKEAQAAHVVIITGGEPAIYDLSELTQKLRVAGHAVHLETSGAFQIRGNFDWITLSPKKWRLPLEENYFKADEFKFIIENKEDISFYHLALRRVLGFTRNPIIWLHPEWSKRDDSEVLKAICEAVKNDGDYFRAGWQIHKMYSVDFMDGRTQVPVPLGGTTK